MEKANFNGADLHCSDISNVDFRLASMIGADLTDTKEATTSFQGANVTGAQVNDPRFCSTGQSKQDPVHQTMHYTCVK